MSDDHSYSDEEVQAAAKEVAEAANVDRSVIVQEIEHLLRYAVPLEDAKESVINEYAGHGAKTAEYERFDSWDSEIPPKVDPDDWQTLRQEDGSRDLRRIGRRLMEGRWNAVVYCLRCEVKGNSVRDAERLAKRRFGDNPSWVKRAYLADQTFYIGYTQDFSKRLVTHATGTASTDSPPPCRLARISDITAVGVVERTTEKERALEFEEAYGENFRDIVKEDSSTFVYWS